MHVITDRTIKIKQVGLIYPLLANRVYGMSEFEGAKAIAQGAIRVNKDGSPYKKRAKRGRPKKVTE